MSPMYLRCHHLHRHRLLQPVSVQISDFHLVDPILCFYFCWKFYKSWTNQHTISGILENWLIQSQFPLGISINRNDQMPETRACCKFRCLVRESQALEIQLPPLLTYVCKRNSPLLTTSTIQNVDSIAFSNFRSAPSDMFKGSLILSFVNISGDNNSSIDVSVVVSQNNNNIIIIIIVPLIFVMTSLAFQIWYDPRCDSTLLDQINHGR